MASTNYSISDHHIAQFTTNVELLLQQKNSRLMGAVNRGSYQGEKAQVVQQYGEVEMSTINPGTAAGQWMGDTVWDDIEHFQRWVFPTDYKVTLPVAQQDMLRTITDPKSPYAEACRAAYERKVDEIIIAAATNDARTGRYDDLVTTALPADQIIGHDYDPAGSASASGLTIDKLIKAKEILLAAQNDPREERFFACSEKQLSDLLRTLQVTSADYNSVKALVQGDVDTFMGFKFIPTEMLTATDATVDDPKIRHCFAWVKSGLHLGNWDSLNVHIDQRPDKNYVWQVYMRATLGATRTQEKKLVTVNCAEMDS